MWSLLNHVFLCCLLFSFIIQDCHFVVVFLTLPPFGCHVCVHLKRPLGWSYWRPRHKVQRSTNACWTASHGSAVSYTYFLRCAHYRMTSMPPFARFSAITASLWVSRHGLISFAKRCHKQLKHTLWYMLAQAGKPKDTALSDSSVNPYNTLFISVDTRRKANHSDVQTNKQFIYLRSGNYPSFITYRGYEHIMVDDNVVISILLYCTLLSSHSIAVDFVIMMMMMTIILILHVSHA